MASLTVGAIALVIHRGRSWGRGDLEIYEIPVNDLAKQLKADKATNMIMLGAFIKKSGVVSLETMNHVLKDTFGNRNPAILKLNKSALQLGYDYLE